MDHQLDMLTCTISACSSRPWATVRLLHLNLSTPQIASVFYLTRSVGNPTQAGGH
jgi:hypothetical protein